MFVLSVCSLFKDDVSKSDAIASNDRFVNNELELMWMKAVVARFKLLS